MTKRSKLLTKILRGTSDKNIDFDELRKTLYMLGFTERINGSHHIFTRSDVTEIINLQPDGDKAKPYQVKQVRELIVKYRLGGEDD